VTRVLAAIVLIAGVVAAVWFLPAWITLVLAAVVAGLAAFELGGLSTGLGTAARLLFAVFASLSSLSFALPPQFGELHAVLVIEMVSMVAIGAARLAAGPMQAPLPSWTIPLLAIGYVGLPLGALSRTQVQYGPRVFTVLFALLAISDSAQYYTGRAFGRRKLAPSISPAKTIEGAAGGLMAAALTGAFLGSRWIPGVSLVAGAVLGVMLGAFGMVGDLFESLIKRGAGVKDSSSIIPGHGGVLDRIDSWLFAAPIYYVYLWYLA
jgi:phosphatidate cytidylyltransferase